jgi:uncharacterized protein
MKFKNIYDMVVNESIFRGPSKDELDDRLVRHPRGLMKSIAHGDYDMVRRMLEAGANANMADFNWSSALYIASGYGYTPIVSLLLKHGADVDAANNYNETPLLTAACAGHAETVRVLLAAGADTSIKDEDGWKAEDLARRNRHNGVAEMIMRHDSLKKSGKAG